MLTYAKWMVPIAFIAYLEQNLLTEEKIEFFNEMCFVLSVRMENF